MVQKQTRNLQGTTAKCKSEVKQIPHASCYVSWCYRRWIYSYSFYSLFCSQFYLMLKNTWLRKYTNQKAKLRALNAWAPHKEPANTDCSGTSHGQKKRTWIDSTFLLGVTDGTGGLKFIPFILYASKSSVAGL